MSITNTDREISYVGNGVTYEWPYTFKMLENSVNVELTEISTGTVTVVSSDDFSVTGLGESGGGTVTYPLSGPALAATHKITLYRLVPHTQPITVLNQTRYYADVVMEVWDRITMMIQDLSNDAGRAAFQLRIGETGQCFDVANRALTFPTFDAAGTPMLTPLADIQTVFEPDVIPRHFETVAEMLNSLEVGGGVGTLWRAAHAMWEEADAGEPSPHQTTAGGVKLFEAGVQFSTIDRFKAAVARGWVWQTNDVVHAGSDAFIFLDDGNTDLTGLPGWAYTTIDGGIF